MNLKGNQRSGARELARHLLNATENEHILTDPPRIANYPPSDDRIVANASDSTWLKSAYAGMFRALEKDAFCITFYDWKKADLFLEAFRAAEFRVAGHLVFSMSYGSFNGFLQCKHECAYLLAKGDPKPKYMIDDVIDWTNYRYELHPEQKPLSILKPLIQSFSQLHGVVLDPFAGAGSTLLAAWECCRDYLGIEIVPHYHAVATERLKKAHYEYANPVCAPCLDSA